MDKTGLYNGTITQFSDPNKDYVDIYLEEPIGNYKIIHNPPHLFKKIPFSDFIGYESIMKKLEQIKVLNINMGEIKTKFGITNKDRISSGLKSVLIALKYADTDYIVDVSSCSSDYTNELCKHIKRMKVKLLIRNYDLYRIKTKLLLHRKDESTKLFNSGAELLDYVLEEMQTYEN